MADQPEQPGCDPPEEAKPAAMADASDDVREALR